MATVAEQISYTDLYARWEKGNWRATEIDFTEDRRQWHEEMTEFERRAALWNYALFFWGEDAVTDGLSPYIAAAPTEEQKYFLATQQVDEARHAVFFNRFMHEVCDLGDGTVGGGLEAIRPQLTWGFRQVFDRLDRMADELRDGPVAAAPGRCDHALPRRDRGDARPARTALHHVIPARPRPAPRVPRGDGQDRPGRAAPHRVRREAAVRPGRRRPGVPARRRRPPPRGPAVDGLGAGPARLGPRLHARVRVRAGGHRPGGRRLARDEAAQRRAADRGAARPPDLRLRTAARDARPQRPAARAGRRAGREERTAVQRPRDHGGAVRVARGEHRAAQRARRARHDPVGLRRCRAVASRGRQRRHPLRARTRRGARRSRCAAGTRTGPTCSPSASTRSGSPPRAACARAATCAGCGARAACSRADPRR